MQVHLEPLSADPEEYRILVAEDDDDDDKTSVGIARRTGPDSWTLTLAGTKDKDDDAAPSIVLTASDAGALLEILKRRFGTVRLEANRLTCEAMTEFVVAVLGAHLSLAEVTRSVPGFVNGVAIALGEFVANNVKAERRTEFLETVVARTAAAANAEEGKNMVRKTVRSFMADVLRTDGDENDSTDPKPH